VDLVRLWLVDGSLKVSTLACAIKSVQTLQLLNCTCIWCPILMLYCACCLSDLVEHLRGPSS